MKNQSILFYSRCLLAALAITGTALEIIKYGIGMFMYYTVQSNLLVSVFAVYMVYVMNKGQNLQDQNFLRIKAGVTMSIMITCVVYHIMLAPLAEHFWRVENLLCHYIVPIYFLLDTLTVDRLRQYKWLDPVWWTSLPLAYMAFGLVNGFFLKIPIPDAKDSPFAYFFLNVPKYGWNYVLTYCAIIFVTYLLFGYVLAGVKSLKPQSFLAKSAPF
ncbi:Pr6Pr family membrane protein [Streptococcus suis]|nr:Pr6Pr family membrane protein [Streptococcus suis]